MTNRKRTMYPISDIICSLLFSIGYGDQYTPDESDNSNKNQVNNLHVFSIIPLRYILQEVKNHEFSVSGCNIHS